jgi:hypothetical protein
MFRKEALAAMMMAAVGPAEAQSAETAEADGPVAESSDELTRAQTACTIACATLAGAGCASVSVACVAGTVWTVGGVGVPCTYVVVAACGAVSGVGAACALQCAQ